MTPEPELDFELKINRPTVSVYHPGTGKRLLCVEGVATLRDRDYWIIRGRELAGEQAYSAGVFTWTVGAACIVIIQEHPKWADLGFLEKIRLLEDL